MWNAVSHFLSFTLGTIAGVTLMCLLQAGRQADEYSGRDFSLRPDLGSNRSGMKFQSFR